jgi:hypothetical protein
MAFTSLECEAGRQAELLMLHHLAIAEALFELVDLDPASRVDAADLPALAWLAALEARYAVFAR